MIENRARAKNIVHYYILDDNFTLNMSGTLITFVLKVLIWKL